MRELGHVQSVSDRLVNGALVRPDQDEVTITVPALRRYVSSLRQLTMALAAQCELTIDEIEDVQMSIDEACTLLLPHVDRARPQLDLTFHLVDGSFTAHVAVTTAEPASLDYSDLSWVVLTALCDDTKAVIDGRTLAIRFIKLRAVSRDSRP
jgi:serine/threonine-protein kinase RsbW